MGGLAAGWAGALIPRGGGVGNLCTARQLGHSVARRVLLPRTETSDRAWRVPGVLIVLGK